MPARGHDLVALGDARRIRHAVEEEPDVALVVDVRLDEALGELGISTPSEECKAMKGLIAESDELMQKGGDPIAKDAALIGAAQRVEHYEIAAYGTARQLADDCGYDSIKDLMDQTLDEESSADKLLTKIATGGMFKAGVNQQAAS